MVVLCAETRFSRRLCARTLQYMLCMASSVRRGVAGLTSLRTGSIKGCRFGRPSVPDSSLALGMTFLVILSGAVRRSEGSEAPHRPLLRVLEQIPRFARNDREDALYQILRFAQNDNAALRMTGKGLRMTMPRSEGSAESGRECGKRLSPAPWSYPVPGTGISVYHCLQQTTAA